MTEKTLIELDLIVAKYTSSMRVAMRDATAFDKALVDLIATSKKLEKTLNDINPNITFKVDTGAIAKAESDIKGISANVPDIDVKVTADTAQAESDIKAIDSNVPDIEVDIAVTADTSQAESDIKGLDSSAPDIDIDVTADVSDAEADIKGLDNIASDVKMKIDADAGGAQKVINAIEDELQDLRTLAKIDLAFNIASGALDAVSSVPIIGRALELDKTLKSVEARTNSTIPKLDRMITTIYTSNFGENYEQIGDVISRLAQFGVAYEDLEGAALSVFQVQQVTGYDFEEIIRTQTQLVNNGLVPSMEDAADLITTGFQQGGDRADDLLDTLNEYAPNFAALGIDGATALSLINQSMETGTFNADKLGDVFKEMGLLLTESVGDNAGKAYDALQKLGEAGVEIDLSNILSVEKIDSLIDAGAIASAIVTPELLSELTVQGDVTGTEFAAGMIAGIDKGVSEGKLTKAVGDFNLVEIFGTPLEDFGINLFKGLDFGTADSTELTGAAENAAATINDTFQSSFDELVRTIEDAVMPSFEDMQVIIEDITDKVQLLSGLLKEGVNLPEALEIALEMPGLADDIRLFESAVGNLLIGLLEFVAAAQDFTGADSSGTRASIADYAAGQLVFDLQATDDGENIRKVVEMAAGRGVSDADIENAINTAVDSAITGGDLGLAQAILDEVEAMPAAEITFAARDANIFAEFEDITIPFSFEPGSTEEEMRAAAETAKQTWLEETGKWGASGSLFGDDNVIELKPEVSTESAQQAIDDFNNRIANITKSQTDTADAKLLNLNFSKEETKLDDLVVKAEDTDTAIADMSTNVDSSLATVTESVGMFSTDTGTSLDDVDTDADLTAVAFEDLSLRGATSMQNLSMEVSKSTLSIKEQLQIQTQAIADAYTAAAQAGGVTIPTIGGGSGGGNFDAKENAEGGFNPAGSIFTWNPKEELAFAGSDVSILNAQTSTALINALSGAGGSTNNNYSINVTQNFQGGNAAQQMQSADIASKILNGI